MADLETRLEYTILIPYVKDITTPALWIDIEHDLIIMFDGYTFAGTVGGKWRDPATDKIHKDTHREYRIALPVNSAGYHDPYRLIRWVCSLGQVLGQLTMYIKDPLGKVLLWPVPAKGQPLPSAAA